MIDLHMPEADYHAHPALNASTLKMVASRPLARVRWDLDHREHKAAFTLGSAAHRLILEQSAEGIVLIDAADYRGKEARVSRDAALAAGKLPLLPHEHDAVRAMRDAVMGHETARELLTGHQPEVSVFTDLYGQPCKARLDAWHEGAGVIVDLKTVGGSVDPYEVPRMFETFGYAQQAAHYIDLLEVETGFAPEFHFVLVEKEPPYLVSVVTLDPEWIEDARAMNHAAAAKWARAVETNEFPGYTGATTINRPAWARKKETA